MSRIYDETRIHASWRSLFSPDILRRLDAIEAQIGEDHVPAPREVLRFAGGELFSVRVVLLGAGPYPQPEHATGRCFEMGGLRTWAEGNVAPPLRNLVRGVYRTLRGTTKSFAAIRGEMARGTFALAPPDRLFDLWESQGVLAIHAWPTCAPGGPGAHRAFWRPFSLSLLRYLYIRNRSIAWLLLGGEAQALWHEAVPKYLARHRTYVARACPHPGFAGGKSGQTAFVDCDGLDWAHRECGIEWAAGETPEAGLAAGG